MKSLEFKAKILDEKAMDRSLMRLAHEIIERNRGTENIILVGIKSRGVPIAQRICRKIKLIEDQVVPVVQLDITMYRDDLSHKNEHPVVKDLDLDVPIDGKTIILVDDVIFTGRTVRAAMDAIMKKGRPSQIQLAVLVDRGHRELPIRPDYVGKNVPTSRKEVVKVKIVEIDKVNEVSIYQRSDEA